MKKMVRKVRSFFFDAYRKVEERLGLAPCPPRKLPTWGGLLELKRRYSGTDGLTADLVQIGELQKYYNSLPEKLREEYKGNFTEMLEKGCNWHHILPFMKRINGFDTQRELPVFKDFFLHEDSEEKIRRLKKNLDATSITVVNTFIYRCLQLPEFYGEFNGSINIFGLKDELRKFLRGDNEDLAASRYTEEIPQYRIQYNWEKFNLYFEPSCFLFHHGLRGRSKRVLDYIRGGDFIDGGAWIGDSALVLAEYAPRQIHSFEISPQICAKYAEVMKANGISPKRAVINNIGLDEKCGHAQFNDNNQENNTLDTFGHCTCELTTLDSYTSANNLEVRFIKFDLEGFGLRAIKGASETIRQQLPILSIGIYHTPEEFFEIKPFLENLTDQYVFTVERHHTDFTSCWDTVLMAVPKFLF